ncbi:MAG: amidohydrolase family protein [Acetanaerobacterium sp.]
MDKNHSEIWDMHGHIFPAKIAEKAAGAIGEFYDIPMRYKGSADEIIKSGAGIGVKKQLVCSSATTPAQVQSINTFIAEECKQHPQFIGFGALHPDMEDAQREVRRIIALGLVGVKLHPDFQRFQIDSPRALELYRVVSAYHLPILFHTGDARYDYSSPRRLAKAMDKVPTLVAIAAHFGGYTEWEIVADCLTRPGVYFDTSSSLFTLPAEQATAFIRTMGADRFFFGVDFPMWDHAEELARFDKMSLTEQEREAILSQNAKRFIAGLNIRDRA